MGTTWLKNGTPGRNRWTRSTGLGIEVASGHESAPIRWAWVSGDPAGLSQRRSGGLESAAIRRAWVRGGPAGIESEAGRRALSQRRSGGVISRERRGAPGGAATREPPPAADISRDRRAWGLAASRLAAIPPNSHAVLQWAMAGITSGDFHAAGQTQTNRLEQNKNFSKNRKQNEVKGRHLRLGLVFCHGAHTREEQEHADEDINSNNSI